MTGETAYEAFDHYARPIVAALGCVTEVRLGNRFIPTPGNIQTLTFDSEDPAPLKRSESMPRLHLEFNQFYRLVEVTSPDDPGGRFRIRTAGYLYSIADRRGVEVISYHWHPEAPRGARPEPHAHVKMNVSHANDPTLEDIFPDLHMPTGRIDIEMIVRFLIEQLRVEPLKSNWDDVLKACEELHRAGRA